MPSTTDVSPIPLEAFATQALALYEPPARSKAAWYKARQVLSELSEAGGRTTADITPELITRWIALHPGRSAETVRGMLGYLSALCKFAMFKGYLARDPFEYRRVWLRDAPLPDDYDDDENFASKFHPWDDVSRVLALLENERGESWKNHRLYALAATVALTGVRKDEALHFQVRDFRDADGVLEIHPRRRVCKTRKSAQPVIACEELRVILRRWIGHLDGSLWMFPTLDRSSPWRNGSPGHKPLDQLKAAGLRAGVEGLTFQSLRHSWATMAESRWGLTEPQIQRQLRHTRLATQRHYRHADVANLRAALRGISYQPTDRGVRSHGTQTGLRA